MAKRRAIKLNRSIRWQRAIDDFFKRFDERKKHIGQRTEKTLTVLMIASIFLLILTIIFVIYTNRDGRTNWAIYLHDIDIQKVINAPHEIVVLDYSLDRTDKKAISSIDVARIKASGKMVIAYISVGKAENDRYYWDKKFEETPPEWAQQIDNENIVKYWDKTWQDIIFKGDNSYIDRIKDAGFDGVYLANIDVFYSWEGLHTDVETENEDDGDEDEDESAVRGPHEQSPEGYYQTYRELMAEMVVEISEELKTYDEQMKVFIHNGYAILPYHKVIRSIDGIGVDNLQFFEDAERSEDDINFFTGILDQLIAESKIVLAVEYITDQKQINRFCTLTQSRGYIPFVTNPSLDSIPDKKVCK